MQTALSALVGVTFEAKVKAGINLDLLGRRAGENSGGTIPVTGSEVSHALLPLSTCTFVLRSKHSPRCTPTSFNCIKHHASSGLHVNLYVYTDLSISLYGDENVRACMTLCEDYHEIIVVHDHCPQNHKEAYTLT